MNAASKPAGSASLVELAASFLKLGCIAFGGPAAHIALLEQEIVTRRGWLTCQEFLDFLGLSNLIPGPTSTELALYVGRRLFGWAGLIVGGLSFILPSALMVVALAWAYVRFHSLPQIAGVLYGVKPVVIAVIVQAIFRLARTALKSAWLAFLCAAALLAAALGLNGLLIFAMVAAVTAVAHAARTKNARSAAWFASGAGLAAGSGAAPISLKTMFLVFFKIGAIMFGGGYVLVAFLRSNLVQGLGWITERQLLDAIAMGQVTPGPISTAATFLGYLLMGMPGAVVATVAIFLPAFLIVALTGSFVSRLREWPLAASVLDGINAAALAIIVVVAWQLGRSAIVDATAAAIAVVSGVLLIRYRVNSAWLVLAGAAVGAISHAVR